VKQIRTRLTYANVMSSIAVFLILGGATAFAAKKIGSNEIKSNAITTGKIKKEAVAKAKIKNSAVDASKLATNAVTTDKIADGAVTNPKLGENAVTGGKVADGSLTGTDINQGSLNAVKAANVYGVSFQETGTGAPKLINASDPGIKSGGCFLVCAVEFPQDVSKCSYTASSTFTAGGSGEPAMAETFPSGSADSVLVAMWNDEGNLTAHDFALTVVCPNTP
jgi:hypothetical protein